MGARDFDKEALLFYVVWESKRPLPE